MEQDKSVYQRLHLSRPLDGRFGKTVVRILEVSGSGAIIEHEGTLPIHAKGTLRFTWRDQALKVKAEVIRSSDQESGLRFTGSDETLRRLIAESAEEVLRAQQANMEGAREANVVGDETLTSASAGLRGSGYIVWTFGDDGWKKRRALLPDQPDDGFTVAAAEPIDQVELLKKTWEGGDEEAKRMTRLLAEMSAASVRMKS